MAGHIASSSSVNWNTPDRVLKHVRAFFKTIDLDPCSNEGSVVGAGTEFCLPQRDGLQESWAKTGAKTVYINPPFGSYYLHKISKRVVLPKEMKKLLDAGYVDKQDFDHISLKDWVAKAEHEYGDGKMEIIMLLPSSVGTKAWQKHIFQTADAVCFVSGRLKFIGAAAGAPMDCACVYWGSRPEDFAEAFEDLGFVVSF